MTLAMRAKLNMLFLLIFTLPTWIAGFALGIQVIPLLIGSWLGYNIFLFSKPGYKPFKVRELIAVAIGFALFYGSLTKELQDSALIAVTMAVCLYFFIRRHNRMLYAGQPQS